MQYRTEFEFGASSKRDLDPEVLMSIFLNGLKSEIQASGRIPTPFNHDE